MVSHFEKQSKYLIDLVAVKTTSLLKKISKYSDVNKTEVYFSFT